METVFADPALIRYRQQFARLNGGFALCDARSAGLVVRHANAQLDKLLASEVEPIGRTLADLITPASYPGDAALLDILTRQGSWSFERLLDGGCWLAGRLLPLCDVAGRIDYLLLLLDDASANQQHYAEFERNRVLLQKLTQIHTRFIQKDDPHQLFSLLLDLLLSEAGSEYGFIGEVLREPDGTPYLKVHVISEIGWDAESRALYMQHRSGGMLFRNLDTLFGATLTSGKPVIANDPANDPRSGGTPPGHPVFDNYLGLPLYHRGVMIGMLGVANRQGGFAADLVTGLMPLVNTCSALLAAQRSEREHLVVTQHLQQSEGRLQAVLDSLAEGLLVISRDHEVLLSNPSAEAILGLPSPELYASSSKMVDWQAVDGDGSPLSFEAFPHRRTLRDGRPISDELLGLRRPDGRRCWISVNTRPLFLDEEPTPFAVICSFSDMTRQRAAEVALSESEVRWRLALECAGDLVFDINIDTGEVGMPERWCAFLGIGAGKTGRALLKEWRRRIHPDDLGRVNQLIQQHIDAHSERFDAEYRLYCERGWLWVRVRGRVLGSENGTRRMIGTLSDVTEQHRLHADLGRYRQMIAATSDAIAFFCNDGRLQIANDAMLELFGQPRAAVLQRSLGDCLGDDLADFLLARIGNAPRVHFQRWLPLPNAGPGVFDVRLERLAATPDQPAGLMLAIRDVTRRARDSELLREVQRVAVIGGWEADHRLERVHATDGVAAALGLPWPEAGMGLTGLFDALPDDGRARLTEAVMQAFADSGALALDLRLQRDGAVRHVRFRGEVRSFGESERRLVGAVQDVTAEKRASAELKLSALVFEHCNDGVLVMDAGLTVVSANPASCRLFGRPVERLLGLHPDALMSEPSALDVWQRAAGPDGWSGELVGHLGSGRDLALWGTLSCVRDSHGVLSHYIAVITDFSERKRAEAQIEHMARYDFLTGLPNRVVLEEALAQTIERSHLAGRRFALLFVDLDRFKNINDTHGHSAGDQILRAVANRLQAVVGSDGLVCRYGGDEFVILLESLATPEAVEPVLGRLHRAVSKPTDIGFGLMMQVSPSIGVSFYPQDGDEAETLLKHADAALYQAKADGRDTYCFFQPEMRQRAAEYLALEIALRQALPQQQLYLRFQPQLELATGRVDSIEALLRWRHPVLGQVSPDRFIPIAEETGMIVPISLWVVEEALKLAARLQTEGRGVPVVVNLSVSQFRAEVIDVICERVRASGLPAGSIDVEITETMLLSNSERVLQLLAQLRETGVGLVLDDFGVGYSSLSYLRQFPFHKVKIDRSFVAELPVRDDDALITRAMIDLAHGLRLKVVAEGIETAEQAAMLRSMSCDVGQGYWLAEPLPLPALLTFLDERA
ncbi:EAL domain-containing protein [Crenobacter sp. SG2305]|uniref:EAL domain-containing protein n=1 Tax=Crenobacter oryzisoli TaxID=3056844 RepID=UPI0025AAD2D9|nr:EAL domain-containing protein [Crenobacter sp. SG2305]MDN0083454.1 EAL domain-containing protein [Crenobacter sp. SG2305]